MDRGVWQATVREVTESDMTEGLNMDTQVQLEMLILSEVGQREKASTVWYHLYAESKI